MKTEKRERLPAAAGAKSYYCACGRGTPDRPKKLMFHVEQMAKGYKMVTILKKYCKILQSVLYYNHRKGVNEMFTQYSEEYDCWGIYKLVQKDGKIKAECLAVEWTKKAALRKMHELYERSSNNA